jgi:hypothetical protein
MIDNPSILAQKKEGNFLLSISSHSVTGLLYPEGTVPDIMCRGFSTYQNQYSKGEGIEWQADRCNSISLLPKVGYFVMENLALGLDGNLAYIKYTYGISKDKHTGMLFSAGFFARFYLPEGKMKSFVEAGAIFGSQILNDFYQGGLKKSSFISGVNHLNGGFGLEFPVGSMASFDAIVRINSLFLRNISGSIENSHGSNRNYGININFLVRLGE